VMRLLGLLLGLIATAGTKGACVGDACAVLAKLKSNCAGANFGSGSKAWDGESGNPCLTRLSETEAQTLAVASGLTIAAPFTRATGTKGLYKVGNEAFFGTGGTDEQERATPANPTTESRVPTNGKYTWQGLKCNNALQLVEIDLSSLGTNVVCTSWPCDELVGISSLRVFNVKTVNVTDDPKPCLCDSPQLGRDLHEVCHERAWLKFWNAHKENTTSGVHNGNTTRDGAWADYWKTHWTDHWADYWSKFWTIRYSRTLSYSERASQSAALEAQSSAEMKAWKVIGCPDKEPALLGSLPENETAADAACKTDPSVCASNAACTAVSTSHRCVCNTGYVGTGIACKVASICDVNHGGCHGNAICESTGTTSRKCTCNATAGYSGSGEDCTGPDSAVAAAAILKAAEDASARALAGLAPIAPIPAKPACACSTNKPCKHDRAMVCYPMGTLWGKKFCWHGTSNCHETVSPAPKTDDVCASGSCPAGSPCKHNRAPNCYTFQFGVGSIPYVPDSRPPENRCFHGTTYCPPAAM